MLPSSINYISTINSQEPHVIDMIKLADHRIMQLQCELDEYKQSKEIIETKLLNFKNQVENRDNEIERLNRLLDGGRSYDVVSLEGVLRNNEKVIAHQNIQLEFLQDKNHQLESRIQELLDTKQQVLTEKHKNQNLNRSIQEINRIAKNSEIEKQRVCDAADRELDQANYEIQRSKDEISRLEFSLENLEKENRDLNNQKNNLKCELDQRNIDVCNLNELISKIQDEKSKQMKKISKLIENERELVMELDTLKSGKRLSTSRAIPNKSFTAKLDNHIKNVENERDSYKQEVDTLQKLLKNSQNENKASKNSFTRSASLNSNATSNHKSRKETKSPLKRASPLKKETLPLKDFRENECFHIKITDGNVPKICSSSTSPLRNSNNFNITNNEDVRQLKKERDELQSLLDKFECHMSEIQSNVEKLTKERDSFKKLYEETKEELRESKCDVIKTQNSNVRSHTASLAAQSVLKRVESEREAAFCELKNLVNERDSIKERLKFTTENFIKEKACLEQQIEDLQVMLRNVDLENKQNYEKIQTLNFKQEHLESKLHEQNLQMVQTTQELNDQRSTSTQIRLLAEESERALDEQQKQLRFKTDELHDLEQNNFKLEQKLYDLQELNRSLKDEVNNLRNTISALDKDKDKLLISVDEKTVENVSLKQEITSKTRCIDEFTERLNKLEATCDRSNDDNKQKLKEITGLRIQLDRSNESNSELSRRIDAASRENKRLQDDLITITRENQVIHCELEKCNGDKEHLKEKVTDFSNEMTKLQEIISQKELERNGLLEQYRNMNSELNAMKLTINAFENEANNLKIEIQMKDNDNKRLREHQEITDRDLQQQFTACQEYEVKLSGANRSMQRLEETFKKLQQENKDLAQDLMNTRELSSRLEQNKEDLMRQINSKELDCEQLVNELSDKRAENDLLKSQVNSERGMVKNLEDLIACNREKDFQIQLSNQERDSEIKLLKDRICLGEQKIQTQNKEITILRGKLVENESDLERIKRQLTNERFEKEKCAQELRKYNDNSINESSSRYNSRCHSPSRSYQTSQPSVTFSSSLQSNGTNIICNSVSGATAAVAAARAAVDASNNANTITNRYRSISPVRSLSPCKESRNYILASENSTNLRYSTHYESERK